MGIQQDGAAGQLQFKLMAEQRRGQEEPQAWRSVRRGWCMGDEQFRNELPEQMRPGMAHLYLQKSGLDIPIVSGSRELEYFWEMN